MQLDGAFGVNRLLYQLTMLPVGVISCWIVPSELTGWRLSCWRMRPSPQNDGVDYMCHQESANEEADYRDQRTDLQVRQPGNSVA